MFPILQLGPLAIQTPGLLLLLSVWLGLTFAEKRAHWHGIEAGKLDNLVLVALAGFVLGGRFTFAAANLSSFLASPFDIFSLNYSLFDPLGGLATCLIVGWIYGQRRGFLFWATLDALTPFLSTLVVGIGAAHLASGDAFGKVTSLPWGIFLFGATRHPTQVYEIAAGLFILGLVNLRQPFAVRGKQFLLFVAVTAGASLFLEAFRGDSILLAGGFRQGQVAAWLILAAAFIGLEQLSKVTGNGNG